jgi:hypothetical protein
MNWAIYELGYLRTGLFTNYAIAPFVLGLV